MTRRKYNVGRITPTLWLFGGICVETGECFTLTVQDRKKDTLVPIFQQKILPQNNVYSDQWPSYRCLNTLSFIV